MRKIREVLRLKWAAGMSNRRIAASCGVSRPTVGEYLCTGRVGGLDLAFANGCKRCPLGGAIDELLPLHTQMSRNTHNFPLDTPIISKAVKLGNLSTPPRPNPPVSSNDTDVLMRLAAFKRVEMLSKMHYHLTHRELSTGFTFQGERIPLFNP